MIRGVDLSVVPLFAQLDSGDREDFARRAADIKLLPQHWLLQEGQPSPFFVLLEGTVEMFKEVNGRAQSVGTAGPGDFFGELSMLLQSSSLVSIRAGELCRLASFDRQLLHEIMARHPMVGEAIFKVMTERFARAQGYAKAAPSTRVVIRGGHLNPLWQPLRSFLFANHIPYEYDVVEVGVESSAESPLSIVIDGVALSAEPSLRLVAESLQLQTAPTKNFYDVVIVGAGPAGMAAAVYASSEGLGTIVIERSTVGGQAGTSSRIENYLGFPGGIW